MDISKPIEGGSVKVTKKKLEKDDPKAVDAKVLVAKLEGAERVIREQKDQLADLEVYALRLEDELGDRLIAMDEERKLFKFNEGRLQCPPKHPEELGRSHQSTEWKLKRDKEAGIDLMRACEKYDVDRFNEFFSLFGDTLRMHMDARDDELNTPLHGLCFCTVDTPEEEAICLYMIKRLIAAGAELNGKNEDGLTPLMIAISNCRFDIMKLLLEGGCGTDPEHIHFDQVFSDSIDPFIYKQDWMMWTMISGERPKESFDGHDFEPGYFDDWPEQVQKK